MTKITTAQLEEIRYFLNPAGEWVHETHVESYLIRTMKTIIEILLANHVEILNEAESEKL